MAHISSKLITCMLSFNDIQKESNDKGFIYSLAKWNLKRCEPVWNKKIDYEKNCNWLWEYAIFICNFMTQIPCNLMPRRLWMMPPMNINATINKTDAFHINYLYKIQDRFNRYNTITPLPTSLGGTAHDNDVIMSAMASQISSLTIIYSTVYSGTDQRKLQSSASLAFVRGIHRWPVNPVIPLKNTLLPIHYIYLGISFYNIVNYSYILLISVQNIIIKVPGSGDQLISRKASVFFRTTVVSINPVS